MQAEFFFLREWERSETKVAEEYFWAIIQAAGRSYCGRLGSSVLAIWIECRLPCTYISNDHMHNQVRLSKIRLELDFLERNHCVSPGVSVHFCNIQDQLRVHSFFCPSIHPSIYKLTLLTDNFFLFCGGGRGCPSSNFLWRTTLREAASTSVFWQGNHLLWWIPYIGLLSITPFLAENDSTAGFPKAELHQIYTTNTNKNNFYQLRHIRL